MSYIWFITDFIAFYAMADKYVGNWIVYINW